MLTLTEGVIAILATGHCSLCGHLVGLVLVHVLSPDLDVGGVNSRPRGLFWVEHETDSPDLGEPGVQLGPLRHPVLQRLVDLLPLDIDEHESVNSGEDSVQILKRSRNELTLCSLEIINVEKGGQQALPELIYKVCHWNGQC